MNRLALLFVAGFAMPMAACAGGSSPSMTAPSTLVADPTTSLDVTQRAGITIKTPSDVRAGVDAHFTLTVTGPSLEVTLDFGDGTAVTVGTITQAVVSHVYAAAGSYTLTVTAKGAEGGVASASAPVFVKSG